MAGPTRTLKKAELWSHVTQVGVLRVQTTTPGDTTVKTGGVAAGATTCPVTASANFSDTDPVIIDSGEFMEANYINGAPADPMPLRFPVRRAHLAGAVFKEMMKVDLGDISDDGVTCGIAGGELNPVKSATKRWVQGYVPGHLEGLVEFKVENFNLLNLASALGIPEANITGLGTSVSPWRLVTDGTDELTQTYQAFYFTGATKGGGTVEIQIWGPELDPTKLSMTFVRGAPALCQFSIRPTGGIAYSIY